MDPDALELLPGAIAALIIGVPLTILFSRTYRRRRKRDKEQRAAAPENAWGRLVSRFSHLEEVLVLAIPVGFVIIGVILLGVTVSRLI